MLPEYVFNKQFWIHNSNNIFTYSGNLFGTNKVIIIGAESNIHAVDLVISVYLTEVSKTNNIEQISQFKENIEDFINIEISNNIIEGYPYNSEIENEIKHHLNKILNNNLESNWVKKVVSGF